MSSALATCLANTRLCHGACGQAVSHGADVRWQSVLGNSGSDANDTLLKLIRYHAEASGQPQRVKVIAREQGYHGVTLASAALTAIPTNHAHFQLPFEALGV